MLIISKVRQSRKSIYSIPSQLLCVKNCLDKKLKIKQKAFKSPSSGLNLYEHTNADMKHIAFGRFLTLQENLAHSSLTPSARKLYLNIYCISTSTITRKFQNAGISHSTALHRCCGSYKPKVRGNPESNESTATIFPTSSEDG